MFKTIVVGHGGTPNAEPALAVARSLAGPDSHLVVVHVVELVGGKGGTYPLNIDEDEVRASLEAQVSEMKAEGVDAELTVHHLQLGGPAHVIAEEAARVGADLVVVGSRGHSAFTQLIVGSVPVRLLHLAHCPVLVVPSPAPK